MSNATVQVGPTHTTKNGREIIHALLGGTMEKTDTKLVQAWAEGLNAEVRKVFEKTKTPVGILVDLRNMQTYTDPSILTILVDLMKKDSNMVYRTATFGGNAIHEMIEGVIVSMAGRYNLKNFKSEEEALSWLSE